MNAAMTESTETPRAATWPQAVAARHDGSLSPSWITANVQDGFSLLAVGDLIITEAVSPLMRRRSPDLMDLLGSADVAFGNFEVTTVDLRKFGGYPEALAGGGWLIGSDQVPQDLRAMGFNLVGRANNHTVDWGVAGMRATNQLLDDAGIVHAGTGENLAQARAPRVLSTTAGRVALVALASRFEANARAIDPLGEIPARPGLNSLRTTRYVRVSPERLAVLAKIRDAQPAGSVRRSVLASDAQAGVVTLFDTKYKADPDVGDGVAFTFAMDPRDRIEILRNVRQAKQAADFAIVSVHTHEPGNYSAEPPDFLPLLAHEAIDNGADAFIAHGPHRLRGIEIYRGKPIFYSLGNFLFMDNTQQPITRDEYEKDRVDPAAMTPAEFMEQRRVHGVFRERVWFESIVAVSRFDSAGLLTELRLHPVELHYESGRDADRGIPRIAPAEVGTRVLRHLQDISSAYGTEIEMSPDGKGVIRVS